MVLLIMKKTDLLNPKFDATIDIFRSEARLPMLIDQIGRDKINLKDKDNVEVIESNLQLNRISDAIVDFQPYATGSMDIAPFYHKGLLPSVLCNPKQLIYIKDNYTTKIIWLPNRVIYSSNVVHQWRTTESENWVLNNQPRTSFGLGVGLQESAGMGIWRNSIAVNRNLPSFQTSTTTVTESRTKTSSVVGEEIVESKIKQINMIPQPYIKPGSIIRVKGSDFPVDSEIGLLLDSQQIITPMFNNTCYNSSALPPSSTNPLSDPTFNTETNIKKKLYLEMAI